MMTSLSGDAAGAGLLADVREGHGIEGGLDGTGNGIDASMAIDDLGGVEVAKLGGGKRCGCSR